jgi:hypothetical protein
MKISGNIRPPWTLMQNLSATCACTGSRDSFGKNSAAMQAASPASYSNTPGRWRLTSQWGYNDVSPSVSLDTSPGSLELGNTVVDVFHMSGSKLL